ncbi:hypothetical protein SISSUDRAFT_986929 [Sistotremastrum suecicum HHB10207 ss-3]|uniref:Uncharacterized protein n=1 Tax=Sistotremastrum suecicum HHB10207 ss-3 TaxID=1314776 RepID=A0A166CXP4_9AGAM|nr:hypothetical protein SISSUDRAFT_986929 [Sistotremastrum suecicum HHB10207 ss-3]
MQSIEPHLRDALEPLRALLPDTDSQELSKYLSGDEVPYDFLQRVSRWSQANSQALKAHGLQPTAYSMIVLLAGSLTSPSSRFPKHNSEAESPPEISTAKAVTTLINAILCVFASGFATLWAAKHSGWRYEWQMLCACLVATVVAISEVSLYMIWESRRDSRKHTKKTKSINARHKKIDSQAEIPPENVGVLQGGTLRQRTAIGSSSS